MRQKKYAQYEKLKRQNYFHVHITLMYNVPKIKLLLYIMSKPYNIEFWDFLKQLDKYHLIKENTFFHLVLKDLLN